ncbi:phage baseplate assembly protein V [Lysobacter sp. Root604]|uniref:phage baseplate assembly protein V n=1 Tax=Lysobacter sp. Root604 TaxID=1736568 RepID=UPI0006F69E83|nr:phage baseplate assembly protein V [Lysobacter sp. Root604]KRA15358.1 baseplate assembly protein [Lysobacter sp. Root604]
MDSVSELQRQLGNAIRLGTVAEVDLVLARCRIDTGEVKTDFLPWFVPRAGETIEWSAPTVGEQGVLLCPGGDTNGAVFLRGIYSDAFAAPANAAGQHLVRFRDGALIQYDDESHALAATLPSGGTAEITADGGVTINGPLTVNGDTQINGDAYVSGMATAQTDVIGGGKSLKNHPHKNVQPGSGVSGPPV